MELQTHDLSYFLGKIFCVDNVSKNMLVYQPTLDTLELKKDKSTDYILIWISKGVYTSKLKPLNTAFLHSMKSFRHKTGNKFDKDLYATKTVNAYIV